MSDSVPSLKDLAKDLVLSNGGPDGASALESAIFTYSRAHDPAVKAAREAMESVVSQGMAEFNAPDDPVVVIQLTREEFAAVNAALRLLDGKAVPHE